MTNETHDWIKAHLASQGVTDDAHVGAAIDAHEVGVDVEGIIRDVKAGVPQWLALLKALHLIGSFPPPKKAPAKASANKPAE